MRKIIDHDPIISILSKHLLANEQFATWERWSKDEEGNPSPIIVPRYINVDDDSVYPLLTIYRDYGVDYKNRTGFTKANYFIHGWLKQSLDESVEQDLSADTAYLMNMVTETLADSPVTGKRVHELANIRLVDSRCPCWESTTRTMFFMTDWLITASPSLFYEEGDE